MLSSASVISGKLVVDLEVDARGQEGEGLQHAAPRAGPRTCPARAPGARRSWGTWRRTRRPSGAERSARARSTAAGHHAPASPLTWYRRSKAAARCRRRCARAPGPYPASLRSGSAARAATPDAASSGITLTRLMRGSKMRERLFDHARQPARSRAGIPAQGGDIGQPVIEQRLLQALVLAAHRFRACGAY